MAEQNHSFNAEETKKGMKKVATAKTEGLNSVEESGEIGR